jgi:hypothetical protein
MGIEEEEVQATGKHNKDNIIIVGNFPCLETDMAIQVQETSMIPARHDQNRTCPWHITVKTITTENKERILKAVREKSDNI